MWFRLLRPMSDGGSRGAVLVEAPLVSWTEWLILRQAWLESTARSWVRARLSAWVSRSIRPGLLARGTRVLRLWASQLETAELRLFRAHLATSLRGLVRWDLRRWCAGVILPTARRVPSWIVSCDQTIPVELFHSCQAQEGAAVEDVGEVHSDDG